MRLTPIVAAIVLIVIACGSAPATAADLAGGAMTASPTAGRATTVKLPPVHGRFDYQIGGAYAPAPGVAIVDRDRSDSPVAGKYNICYVNAFQSQPEDASFWTVNHPDLLLMYGGKPVSDPDWPGEYILDTSTATKRSKIAVIVDVWIAGCASKGFQAVEPDNLDSWTRSKNLLTEPDDLAMATLIARYAHGRGLAIAQKNAGQLGNAGKVVAKLDFAIAEECQLYQECPAYTSTYGNHVIEIEYTDNPRTAYDQACAARGKSISVIRRDRYVLARGRPGYQYEYC